MSDSPILELRGVSKHFGAVQALYQVDFHVAPGEVMALVGDNGAGKSTLIKCIAGIYPFDEGEVDLRGLAGATSTARRTPPRSASRSSTRTWRSADNLDVVAEHVPRPRGDRRSPAARRDGDGGARAGDAEGALGDHDPLRAPARRRPLRRPAPVRRRREGRDVELEGRDPRRADRRARRGADQAGARAGRAPRRAGSRRDPHLPQPARHLPGRRRHHRPAPRPERVRVQAQGDQPAGGRRGDHRRPALEGPGQQEVVA